jgi:phospholipase C
MHAPARVWHAFFVNSVHFSDFNHDSRKEDITVKSLAKFAVILLAVIGPALSQAQISNFQHVVVIFQENRTPDNLFQGLCGPNRTLCPTPYDLQNFGIDNKGNTILLTQEPLGLSHDPDHSHPGFVKQCDLNTTAIQCRMDGLSSTGCPTNCSFQFVNPSDVGPYIKMAQQYGWANFMFQTNQGPSFPAHQFIFGGTSAPDANSDHGGIFASENMSGGSIAGCIATQGTTVKLIRPPGIEDMSIFPCFEHNTIPDILPSGLTWRYYTAGAGSIWTAPNAIRHICGPNQPFGGQCVGSEWVNNVDLDPTHVLTDIGACNLRNVTWVIPTGKNSDHPGNNQNGGPSWVASIVNAIGNSTSCDGGTGYWHNTAIFITWDDWGGFYDHEPPTLLVQPEGDYQYGFRVPLVVVSAYTPVGYVNNARHDFGSILRFIEHNVGIMEGTLTFADQRAANDLTGFFNLSQTPRVFVPISAPKGLKYFLNDHSPVTDPDDD